MQTDLIDGRHFSSPYLSVMQRSLLHLPHFQYLHTLIFHHQEKVADVPRFCLFFISFGLELIALVLSAVADIPPEDKERVKKVSKHPFLFGYLFA